LGLAFVELNMNLPEYQADKLDVIKFREIADEYDIYFTIHLDGKNNDEAFNIPFVHGQGICYIPDTDTIKPIDAPENSKIVIVAQSGNCNGVDEQTGD
jgi:hypothetical protein